MSNKNYVGFLTPKRGALIASVIAFVVYLLTMNRTFGFIDKGELVAVASTGGISHPTGYPTIMLLGYLFTKIIPMRDVVVLNALAALLTAVGVGVLTLLFNDILIRVGLSTSRAKEEKKGKGKGKASSADAGREVTGVMRGLLAGLAALGVGFTNTWWDQGNGFEVYSLHAVMMPLVVLLFLRWCDSEHVRFEKIRSSSGETRSGIGFMQFTGDGFWFAFAVGLSFTNHLTTVLLAPALLLYYFQVSGREGHRAGVGGALVRLIVLIPPFLLGLLPYIWLPIRSSMQPVFNWGDPTSLGRLIYHITGRQYHELFNAGGDIFSQQSSYFFGNLPSGLGYLGLALALVGAIHLVRRNRPLALMTSLLFITCVVWSGNYKIAEIGPYYMTAMLALGIFASVGLLYLYEQLGTVPAVGFGAIVVILTLAMNWSVSDESGNTMVEDMTRDVLENLPQNGVVLAGTWDNWVTGSFYLQGVEGVRPDVTVIVAELLGYDWYLDQLEHNHPEFMARIKSLTDIARKERAKFEQGLPYNPTLLAAAHGDIFNAMVDSTVGHAPLFIGPELIDKVRGNYTKVPVHLLVRIATDSLYLPEKFPAYRFTRHPGRVNMFAAEIHEIYTRSAYDRATYERAHGHDTLALKYYDYALSFDPGYRLQDIPSLPLEGSKYVREFIGLYDQLRAGRGR
jgi:hypothetical protein